MLTSKQIMTRSILTFETVFQVLAAEKLLKEKVGCRTVPTPSGFSSSICGISVEILNPDEADIALGLLDNAGLKPDGVHSLQA